MKFIYILYRTVRIETGEYYIGVHRIDTDRYPDFNDPYLGSGHRIKASVKKHGSKAFVRSILAIKESRKEAEALEEAMVTVEIIADPLCLNLAPGGRGGVNGVSKGPPSVEHRQKISDAMKGIPKSPEHRQAISDALKGSLSPLKGIPTGPRSTDTRQAISHAMKGVLRGPRSVETRQKMKDAQKERWRKRKQDADTIVI